MKRPAGVRPSSRPEPPEPEDREDLARPPRRLFGRFGSAAGSDAGEAETGPLPVPIASGRAERESDGRRADGPAADDGYGDVPSAGRSGVWRAARARRRREREEVRRFTAGSRRRRLAWLVSIGGVLVLAIASVAAAYTPIMAVRTIQVEGARLVSSDLIVRDLESQQGTPLPLVDQRAIKAALVRYPLIQTYSVESRPPDTLVIRIVERRPVGVITDGDDFDLVDVAGVVLSSSPERPDGYPLITFEGDPSSVGFAAAAAVLRALPDDVLATVDSITATTVDDVTLTLAENGAVVAWGSAEDSAAKAVALERLMGEFAPDSVSRYDVSSPDSVVIDPR